MPTAGDSRGRLVRILLVVVDVFPEMMRDLIQSCIPSITLYNMIQSDLKMRDNLTSTEQKMVQGLPSGYTEVDVIFVCKVIRHFKLLPPPSSGKWGGRPSQFQTIISDDVERIRNCRNEVCHRPSCTVTEADMQNCFTEFIDIGRRFDLHFGSKSLKTKFEEKIKHQQTVCIDQEMENKYITALEKISELKLQLSTATKDNTTINIFFTNDVENMLKDQSNNASEAEKNVSMKIILYGVGNEADARQQIEAAKEILNEGRFSLQITEVTTGSLVLCVNVKGGILSYKKTLLAEICYLVEDILDVCEHDILINTIIERTEDEPKDQDKWSITFYKNPNCKEKCVVLDVEVSETVLQNGSQLNETVVDLMRDIVPIVNANVICEETGVIDVVVKNSTDNTVALSNEMEYKSCVGCGIKTIFITTDYCTTCSQLLCNSCAETHSKLNISHHFSKTEQDNGSIRCNHHRTEYIDYFCSKHDEVCCRLCRDHAHSTCDVSLIPDGNVDYSALIDETQQSLNAMKIVHAKILDQLVDNKKTLDNSKFRLLTEIKDSKEMMEKKISDIELSVLNRFDELTTDNNEHIRHLQNRFHNITQVSLDLERDTTVQKSEERRRDFILCKLAEQFLLNERQFIDGLRESAPLYDFDVNDRDSLTNFSKHCIIETKQSKLSVELPLRTKQSQVTLQSQRSTVVLINKHSFRTDILDLRSKISEGLFFRAENLILKDFVCDCLHVCNIDGTGVRSIYLEHWPADVAVISEFWVACSLFQDGIAIIDLSTFEVNFINVGFATAIASSNELLIVVLEDRLVRIDLNGKVIKVLSKRCVASALSIDANDFIYFLDETHIYCIEWDGTPVFKQRVNLPEVRDFTVNNKGEIYVITNEGLYRQSLDKTFEMLKVDGINNPRSISCNDSCDLLVVTNDDGDTVTVFQIC